MKTQNLTFALIIHFTLFIIHSGHSQDSLRYSQESGTLQKQRFIDQYDYVFMTKEPTRWMLKAGLERISDQNSTTNYVNFGLEYKLSPSFSLGANYGLVKYGGGGIRFNYSNREIMGRWYYDMKRRIKEGKSANNFSGNYIELNYGRIVPRDKGVYYGGGWKPFSYELVTLSYGIQRRFFNHGWSDFSLSIQHYRVLSDVVIYSNSPYSLGGINDWSIRSHYKIGLALGDIKKGSKVPACDVFKCMEEQKSWLKVEAPFLQIGNISQTVRLGVEYEQKIGKSPFSVNVGYQTLFQGYSFEYKPNADPTRTYFRNFSYSWTHYLNAELRYYALQKLQIAKGKTASNLSGLYVGLNVGIGFQTNATNFVPKENPNRWIAPVIGFQKKLFKNGFVDFKIGVPIRPFSTITSTGANRVVDNNISSLKLGFAF